MDAQPKSWINCIVLHWEDSDALRRCLEYLALSDYPRLRVLVVENGSSPAQRQRAVSVAEGARERFPWFHLLLLGANLGYAGGNNAGVRYYRQAELEGDFCILNPDVCVGAGTLSSMAAARAEGVGLVMCSARTDHGGLAYDWLKLRGYRQANAKSALPVVDTEYAQGACLLIRREAIQGELFDERFFLYWEEVDLSLRVRKAGYKLVSATTWPVTRSDNELSRLPGAIFYSVRNGWLLRQKHPERFTVRDYAMYVARLALVALKLAGRPRLLAAAWLGLGSALLDARAGRYGKRMIEPAGRAAVAARQEGLS